MDTELAYKQIEHINYRQGFALLLEPKTFSKKKWSRRKEKFEFSLN